MPKKRGYGRGRCRLADNKLVAYKPHQQLQTAVKKMGRSAGVSFTPASLAYASRYAQGVHDAYVIASTFMENTQRINAGLRPKAVPRPLQQTTAVPRGRGRPKGSKNKPSVKGARNEEIKKSNEPAKKGKGHKKIKQGTIVTHPRSMIPAWKYKRLSEYKYDVWQTVLLSKHSRLAGSPNTLITSRYPISAPEALDGEKTMTMLFTPFCSHKSGIHTTMFQKVNDAGTDLDHDTTQRLDVIQNKADTQRWRVDNKYIEGNQGPIIAYAGSHGSSATAGPDNQKAVKRYFDQLVKNVKIDLTFTASRAFPVVVSVSLVRAIKPMAPFTLSTDDKRELCNAVGNHGMDYKSWVTEWHHEFTLPGLRVNKKPPTHNIHVNAKCNFLQTNSFNENTTATDYDESATTALGSNIDIHQDEIADGNVSSQFYILIKYRKKRTPQQFTYTQTIVSNPGKDAKAEITIPMVSELSFDIPGNAYRGNNTSYPVSLADSGATTSNPAGAPLEQTTDNIDESKATFYVHGRLMYNWGFKQETESIPSVMSTATSNANFKKGQSLMIDPTYDMTNTTYGLYQQSPDHVNRSASSAE